MGELNWLGVLGLAFAAVGVIVWVYQQVKWDDEIAEAEREIVEALRGVEDW